MRFFFLGSGDSREILVTCYSVLSKLSLALDCRVECNKLFQLFARQVVVRRLYVSDWGKDSSASGWAFKGKVLKTFQNSCDFNGFMKNVIPCDSMCEFFYLFIYIFICEFTCDLL